MIFNKPTLLLSILQLILSSGIREDMEAKDWMRALLILESKGMLYYGFEDGKLSKVSIAYRVESIDDNTDLLIPEEEKGDILWIANYISAMKSKKDIFKEAKYMFSRFKDINVIAYESEGEIVKLRRDHVKEKETTNTSSNVPARP